MNTLLNALQNKHTTGAGIAYLLLKTLMQLAMIWFPDQHDKLTTTAEILEGAAVAYGLVAAGDASKGKAQVKELAQQTADAIKSGDTTLLTKGTDIKTAADLGKLGAGGPS